MIVLQLTEDLLQECYKIINKDEDRLTWKQLGEKYGCDGELIRQKFKSYRRTRNELPSQEEIVLKKHGYIGYDQTKTFKEVHEINKDGSHSSEKLLDVMDNNKLKDEDFLLKVHGYDPDIWEIITSRNSRWNAQLKGGKVTEMLASKISAKPKTN